MERVAVRGWEELLDPVAESVPPRHALKGLLMPVDVLVVSRDPEACFRAT